MSGFDVEREDVELLRLSARSLVSETGESCWGTAYDLSVLIERLVRASGLPAAYFGNGARLDADQAEALGERLPACCHACGEWAGKHERWCVYWQESQPAATSEQPEHYFGCCPECHKEGEHVFVGPDNWFVCEVHMLAWWAGSGLFTGWEDIPREQHEANRALIERCERIEQPICTCSSEQAAEPEPGADSDHDLIMELIDSHNHRLAMVAAYDDNLSELLTWLDLSGLPPVPPAGPPARKPTNWRFDGPEGSEQIPL